MEGVAGEPIPDRHAAGMAAGAGRRELRRGRSVIVVAFLGIAVGVSSTFLFSTGLFLKPVAATFGWGRGSVTFAAFVASMVTALLAPFAGRLADRFGVLRVFLPSVAGLAAGLGLLAWLSAGFVSYVALMALAAIFGAGTVIPVVTKLIIAAFDARRGLALGLSLAGTGVAAGLVPVIVTPVIAAHGWRTGYATLAAIEAGGFILIAVLAWWWRDTIVPAARATHAHPVGDHPAVEDVPVLLRDRTFLLLAGAFFLSAWGILTTVVHFVPMRTDAGVDPARAGRLAGAIGLALIVGRVVIGYLLDRMPAAALAQVLFVLVACGMLVLMFGGAGFAPLAAVVAGIGIGAENDIMSFLVGRHYPVRRFGTVYGALYAVFLIGGSVGPMVSGYLYDATGGYALALLVSAAALIVAALILFALPQPAVRIRRR